MSMATIISILVVSLFMIIVEVTIIPGFGIPGILGFLGLIGGSFAAWHYYGLLYGMLSGFSSLVFVGLLIYIIPKTKIGQSVVLKANQEGDISHRDRGVKIGDIGKTITPLMPSGVADFNDFEVDVVSEGEPVEKNIKVVITQIEGIRVVVKKY